MEVEFRERARVSVNAFTNGGLRGKRRQFNFLLLARNKRQFMRINADADIVRRRHGNFIISRQTYRQNGFVQFEQSAEA